MINTFSNHTNITLFSTSGGVTFSKCPIVPLATPVQIANYCGVNGFTNPTDGQFQIAVQSAILMNMANPVIVYDNQCRPVALNRDEVMNLKPYQPHLSSRGTSVFPCSNSASRSPSYSNRYESPSYSRSPSYRSHIDMSDSGSDSSEADRARSVSPTRSSVTQHPSQLNSKKIVATDVYEQCLRYAAETKVSKDGQMKTLLVNKPTCVRSEKGGKTRVMRIRAKKVPILRETAGFLKEATLYVEEVSVNATGADSNGYVNGVLIHLRCKEGYFETVKQLYRSCMNKGGFNVDKKKFREGREVHTLQGCSAADVDAFNERTKANASDLNNKFELSSVKLGYLLKNMATFCALWKIDLTVKPEKEKCKYSEYEKKYNEIFNDKMFAEYSSRINKN